MRLQQIYFEEKLRQMRSSNEPPKRGETASTRPNWKPRRASMTSPARFYVPPRERPAA